MFFNSNNITWIALKLLYSWIYLYHSPTDTICGGIYMHINSVNSGRCCWSGRDRGFPGNTVHKTELLSQTLLYQTLHARWNENDIQNFLKTVSFLQKYSDIKTPALGFDFETCSAQPSIFPPPTIRISVGGIYFCDITNTEKQLCSPNEPFVVVLEKGFFFFKRNISLWSGLWDL